MNTNVIQSIDENLTNNNSLPSLPSKDKKYLIPNTVLLKGFKHRLMLESLKSFVV